MNAIQKSHQVPIIAISLSFVSVECRRAQYSHPAAYCEAHSGHRHRLCHSVWSASGASSLLNSANTQALQKMSTHSG
jgi:hypothetical protein